MSLDIHRSGCPIQRTGKCLCDYLAQWDDRAEKDALAAFTAQMEEEGRVISLDTLPATSEWDSVFQHPSDIEEEEPEPEIIATQIHSDFDPVPKEEDFATCSKHRKAGWHYTARMSCAQFDAMPGDLKPEFIPRDIEGNPMPTESSLITAANTALKNSTKALEVQSAAYRELQAKHLAVMKADRRTIAALFVLSLAGWGLSLARGIWGF